MRDLSEVFPGLDSGPNCSEGHYSIPWKNVTQVPHYIPRDYEQFFPVRKSLLIGRKAEQANARESHLRARIKFFY